MKKNQYVVVHENNWAVQVESNHKVTKIMETTTEIY